MIVGDPRQRAEAFVLFCDGLEEGGLVEFGRRGRSVAGDVLELADAVASERSCRVALQARIAALEAIVGRLHQELDELRARADADPFEPEPGP